MRDSRAAFDATAAKQSAQHNAQAQGSARAQQAVRQQTAADAQLQAVADHGFDSSSSTFLQLFHIQAHTHGYFNPESYNGNTSSPFWRPEAKEVCVQVLPLN